MLSCLAGDFGRGHQRLRGVEALASRPGLAARAATDPDGFPGSSELFHFTLRFVNEVISR